jgi:hypothetical protein
MLQPGFEPGARPREGREFGHYSTGARPTRRKSPRHDSNVRLLLYREASWPLDHGEKDWAGVDTASCLGGLLCRLSYQSTPGKTTGKCVFADWIAPAGYSRNSAKTHEFTCRVKRVSLIGRSPVV